MVRSSKFTYLFRNLYHYTNEEGKNSILKSGFIKKSSSFNGDALYGDGVYLTALEPSNTTASLILNNWDSSIPNPLDPAIISKTEFVFCVPMSLIPGVREVAFTNGGENTRNIWIYPYEKLELAGKHFTIVKRELEG